MVHSQVGGVMSLQVQALGLQVFPQQAPTMQRTRTRRSGSIGMTSGGGVEMGPSGSDGQTRLIVGNVAAGREGQKRSTRLMDGQVTGMRVLTRSRVKS